MPVPEKWGYDSDQSQIQYRPEGLSNTYDLNKSINERPEYITIYNSHGSVTSRIISVIAILAVLGFCGLLFKYIFNEHQPVEAITQTQGQDSHQN